MRKTIIATFAAVAVLLSVTTPSFADNVKGLQLSKARTVHVEGEITGRSVFQTLEQLSALESSKEPINIVLNSPGGTVIGILVVKKIMELKAKGIEVRCIVDTVAASMAYIYFNTCSERYVHPLSLLLWHSASVYGAQGKKDDLEGIITQLSFFDLYFKEAVIKAMGISEETYDYYDKHDTLFPGFHLMLITRRPYAYYYEYLEYVE